MGIEIRLNSCQLVARGSFGASRAFLPSYGHRPCTSKFTSLVVQRANRLNIHHTIPRHNAVRWQASGRQRKRDLSEGPQALPTIPTVSRSCNFRPLSRKREMMISNKSPLGSLNFWILYRSCPCLRPAATLSKTSPPYSKLSTTAFARSQQLVQLMAALKHLQVTSHGPCSASELPWKRPSRKY